MQTRPSPLQELEKLDAPQSPVLADGGVNWFVYGVNAGRARLLREDGDERQADEIYRQLYEWSRRSGEALPPFPEAELVMGKR